MPILINLRLDPLERSGIQNSVLYFGGWFMYEFWRFVYVQQVVGKATQSFIEFPPMQKGASFNLEALKAELAAKAVAKGEH